MSAVVPQGSVLGPILWNIGYDWVLRGGTLRGIKVLCYADDTLVLAQQRTYREAAVFATAAVAEVVGRINRLGLEVSLNKSEAIYFHAPRKGPPADAHIVVGGVKIDVARSMKYLGLVLDGRWNFRGHFTSLAPKLLKTAAVRGTGKPGTH